MWPFSDMSLASATKIGGTANVILIASLVAGVVSTFFIVQTSNVKEEHWDRDREAARNEAIRQSLLVSNQQTEILRQKQELTKVQERAAKAETQASEAKLALERYRAPRSISYDKQLEAFSLFSQYKGTSVRVWKLNGGGDISFLADGLSHIFSQAGWIVSGGASLSGVSLTGVRVLARNGAPNAAAPAQAVASFIAQQGWGDSIVEPFDHDQVLMPAANFTPSSTEPDVLIIVGVKP